MGLIASTAGVTLWLWTQGQVGVGAVAAATAMALRLNGISHWVMWEMASLFEQIGTVQDGINTLARAPTVLDRAGAQPLRVTRGDIRFEQVSFAYGAAASPAGPVIDGLNLHIRPGEKIGLVGRSGAGKSTIVNLLLRFYDIAHGRVLIDGQDIALATQDSLRAQIGMVTQDTSLLHRSVSDNIRYGRPEAGDAEMVAAAKRAEAHDFIVTLADAAGRTGYDAHVGERGVKLSGGQRQRIAIARVMLKDAPILLLDEATSALDSEVEAAIQQSLNRLMQGKTVVAIAHRLSTIAAMDRLIVLDQGRIVEEGNHYALLAQGGLYARLWAHQSGGFLGEDIDDASGCAASNFRGDLESFVDGFLGGARRGGVADDVSFDAESLQLVREVIHRRVPRAQDQGVDLVDDHRLAAALMLQVDAVRIAAVEPHVGEHLHPELVQGGRGLVPHVERQRFSGGDPVDREPHRPAVLRQMLGDADADPIGAPVDHDHRLPDRRLTAQHRPRIHHLQCAFLRKLRRCRAWRRWR